METLRLRGAQAGVAAASCALLQEEVQAPKLPWSDSGIESKAKPWSGLTTLFGTVLGLSLFALVFPILLAIALLNTALEAVRHAFCLNESRAGTAASFEGSFEAAPAASAEDVTLVIPGTCSYAFWQIGMVHYLCEHFDTRNVKIAGVSSGAVCATFILAMEKAKEGLHGEEASAAVRRAAHEMFAIVEERAASVSWWPLAFLCRLGGVLDDVLTELCPEDFPAGERVSVGVRRWARGPIPGIVPAFCSNFQSRAEYMSAVMASSTVWLIVRLQPCRYVGMKAAWCSDGVNPFSFFCVWEYIRHLQTGLAAWTAPRVAHAGWVSHIYAAWNCGIMDTMLPKSGKHLWVTPTEGGFVQVQYALRISGWFIAEQWRQGYAHAREMDRRGCWHPLRRTARQA